MSVLDHVDVGPPQVDAGVRVGADALADELRVAAAVGHLRRAVQIGHVDGEQASRSGLPMAACARIAGRARGSVSGSPSRCRRCKARGVGAELRLRDRDRRLGLVELAQQEAGEGIAARLGERILRSLKIERPLAARELVAHLVVLVAADFAAEAEGVLAADDRTCC